MIELRIFNSVLANNGLIAVVPSNTWKRSSRNQGGGWQGDLVLSGDLGHLQNIFFNWLGYDVQELVNGVRTWRGMIYEVDLIHQGVRRRRTLDLLGNAIKMRYVDVSTNTNTETAYATDAESISRYGRREFIESMPDTTSTAAEARRDTLLNENAWPWARPVAIADPGETTLEIKVCGYAFTANWKYVTSADGSTGNVNAWLSSIISTDCEFLSETNLNTNTLQVERTLTMDARAWDVLLDLAELGDASGNLWRLYVDNNRGVIYEQVDTTPRYYLRRGILYNAIGSTLAINPWTIQPGVVVRDMDYPVGRAEPGGFLSDARDIFIEEVEVDAQGNYTLKSGLFSESEILGRQNG